MKPSWEQIVNDIFKSENITELQLRAFCTYNILKDRIYTEVLPEVLKILNKEGLDIESIWITVWGKLISAAIYLMVQTVSQYFKDNKNDADNFNKLVFATFLEDFNEQKETLLEYEKNNQTLGRGQMIWALGSQICKAIGREDPNLIIKINILFWEQIAWIEARTTWNILKMPLDKLKEKMLKLNYVKMKEE